MKNVNSLVVTRLIALLAMSACTPVPATTTPAPPAQQIYTITNTTFHDYNGNGTQESGEPAIGDIRLTYKPGLVSCITSSDGKCTIEIPSGRYKIHIDDPSNKFRYILPSVHEARHIKEEFDVDVKNEMEVAIPLAEGFMTLPFEEGTFLWWRTSYKDVMPGPGIRDWKGGRITYEGHKGTDFFMREGTNILAGCPGIVRSFQLDINGGISLFVDYKNSEDEYIIGYGHLADITVEKMQYVSRGDVIGHSGRSKKGSSEHLHFEILRAEQPTDEYPYGLYMPIDFYESDSNPYMLWTKHNEPQSPP